jgi:type II secretory pathway pseudopilin PulG
MASRRIHLRRACLGFTLVELILGMLVTTLVMGTMAAFMSAVGRGWTASESTQATTNITAQAHLRIQRLLREARQIGAVRTGALDGSATSNAAVLYWKGDANSDNKIQLSELALLEYHPSADPKDALTLRLYQAVLPSGTPDTTITDDNEIFTDAEIDTFRNLSFVKDTYTIVARKVNGVEFHKDDATTQIRPTLDYLIVFPSGETEFGTVTPRGVNVLPAGHPNG